MAEEEKRTTEEADEGREGVPVEEGALILHAR